jgi:hypothetical protein
MDELAQRTPSTLQEFMDKVEELMNAKDTIRAFAKQAGRRVESLDKKKI